MAAAPAKASAPPALRYFRIAMAVTAVLWLAPMLSTFFFGFLATNLLGCPEVNLGYVIRCHVAGLDVGPTLNGVTWFCIIWFGVGLLYLRLYLLLAASLVVELLYWSLRLAVGVKHATQRANKAT